MVTRAMMLRAGVETEGMPCLRVPLDFNGYFDRQVNAALTRRFLASRCRARGCNRIFLVMAIDELIYELENIREEHGNLKVMVRIHELRETTITQSAEASMSVMPRDIKWFAPPVKYVLISAYI